MKQTFDVICVGELLMDFIGKDIDIPVGKTKNFEVHPGGSPANLSRNLSNLGLKTALIATVGTDSFGDFLIERLQKEHVNTNHIRQSKNNATSIILISKSSETADFIPYRDADKEIEYEQVPEELFSQTKILHTTFFALSKPPAQKSILKMLKVAYQKGVQISIDANFSEPIWGNKKEALPILKEICTYNPLIKISDDDLARLFGEDITDEFIFSQLSEWGAKFICLTKGKEGTFYYLNDKIHHIPSIPIKHLEDATGAGDTYWAGFLQQYSKEKTYDDCIRLGSLLASKKLEKVGLLSKKEIQTFNYTTEKN